MSSIISVFITAALGTWLAYVWQQRSAKQTRYFDASKTQYDVMREAATTFSAAIGRRLYAMHRVCALDSNNERFSTAFDELVASIENWNNSYLQIELNVRTLYRLSTANQLEILQSKLNCLSNGIILSVKEKSLARRGMIHDVALLRFEYFQFLQGMIDEANHLFRQMHFGVKINYNRWSIQYFSTAQLIKTLFSGAEDESSVVRTPTDFGFPVDTSDARLRIN